MKDDKGFTLGCLGMTVLFAVGLACWFALVAIGMWIIR